MSSKSAIQLIILIIIFIILGDVYYSVKALINNGRVYSTDVCLPISNITECVNYAEEQAKNLDLELQWLVI